MGRSDCGSCRKRLACALPGGDDVSARLGRGGVRIRDLRSLVLAGLAAAAVAPGGPAQAQGANIAYPIAPLEDRLAHDSFEILDARPSRGLKEEIGLTANVRFADGTEMRVKLRPAGRGASEFNNEPRYEYAAYQLQSLFLDEGEFVVPPTALRMLPRSMLTPYAPRAPATFSKVDDVLVVVQYWLKDVEPRRDILDPERFAADEAYARSMGNLNVLTYTIKHQDSNFGNFLISIVDEDPRAWSVDNGVAFASEESDRGSHWDDIRLPRLPRAAIDRLRSVTPEDLERELAVLGQWEAVNGHFEPRAPGPALSARKGVRQDGAVVQLGLTGREISATARRIERLLKNVDKGKIETF